MTVKDLLAAICDANDAGADDVALYCPSITKATQGKNGLTTITLQVRVKEFTPNSVLNGLRSSLALWTNEAHERLTSAPPEEPQG